MISEPSSLKKSIFTPATPRDESHANSFSRYALSDMSRLVPGAPWPFHEVSELYQSIGFTPNECAYLTAFSTSPPFCITSHSQSIRTYAHFILAARSMNSFTILKSFEPWLYAQ